MGLVLHDFIESGGEWTNAFHIPYPHWVDTRNIGINAGNIRWANTLSDDVWYMAIIRASWPQTLSIVPRGRREYAAIDVAVPTRAN